MAHIRHAAPPTDAYGCDHSLTAQCGQDLEFYDRWLPGTKRRITGINSKCMPHCVMLRGPDDWVARPGYR
jgi:hypothetical protein